MTIKPQEVATILVGGGAYYTDWESVFVQNRWVDAWHTFRFTAAERDRPTGTLMQDLHLKPGDECAIYLGGELAISGVILVRQTSYDANSHGVMLQGTGRTWYAARASILDKDGNFDKMSFEQAAKRVIAPLGVNAKVVGTLDATPFEKLQLQPGETLWAFLERIARPRGIVMGSDHLGNFLLIGDHQKSPGDWLIEGQNILRCQATQSVEAMFSDYVVRGSTAGGDGKYGRQASEQEALVKGTAKRYSPQLTPAEQPVWNLAEVAARANNEMVWHEGTEIRVSVTVQGWFRPSGGIWRTGEQVVLVSPMALLNMALKIETITFTQDSASGTLTQLELVAPWLLKDRGDYVVGDPNNKTPFPPPPDPAKPGLAPPSAPTGPAVPFIEFPTTFP
jgi:prophage tail gpP-like protein